MHFTLCSKHSPCAHLSKGKEVQSYTVVPAYEGSLTEATNVPVTKLVQSGEQVRSAARRFGPRVIRGYKVYKDKAFSQEVPDQRYQRLQEKEGLQSKRLLYTQPHTHAKETPTCQEMCPVSSGRAQTDRYALMITVIAGTNVLRPELATHMSLLQAPRICCKAWEAKHKVIRTRCCTVWPNCILQLLCRRIVPDGKEQAGARKTCCTQNLAAVPRGHGRAGARTAGLQWMRFCCA
eukprot:1159999-Pelagomonas_calceolata.AAC.7